MYGIYLLTDNKEGKRHKVLDSQITYDFWCCQIISFDSVPSFFLNQRIFVICFPVQARFGH